MDLCLDHLVLTVADVEATCRWYARTLGMEPIHFAEGRRALHFGQTKINLHPAGAEFEPKALRPTPGSADLCFVTCEPLAQVETHLRSLGVAVELGPVERTGASGPLLSLYIRDPDGNLVEIANQT